MAKHTMTRRCAHKGCREFTFSEYDNKTDLNEAYQRYSGVPWYCNRHDPDGENLQPTSTPRHIVDVYVSEESEYENLKGRGFWRKNDAAKVGSGFIYGDGWNAYGEDFPLGTKIVVETIVKVILPEKRS